jgi:DNA polymerase-3 subunit delta'
MRYFDRVITSGRIAHAYLLHGPDRVGKRATAYAVATALVCPGFAGRGVSVADAGDGCGICRAVASGAHPDITVLDRERTLVSDKETRKAIPIEDIRELKRRFSFASVGDSWRIAIIDEVDTMSRDAQVAFLKILEEPGPRTLFFLIASSRDAVAPTIVSRAMSILFSPVPDSILAPYVRVSLPGEDASAIVASAMGRAGAVISWVRDSRLLAEERKTAALFAHAFARGLAGCLDLGAQIGDDDIMRRRACDAWVVHLRRSVLEASGVRARRHAAARIARVLDLDAAMEETNANPRLALDMMFAEGAPAHA